MTDIKNAENAITMRGDHEEIEKFASQVAKFKEEEKEYGRLNISTVLAAADVARAARELRGRITVAPSRVDEVRAIYEDEKYHTMYTYSKWADTLLEILRHLWRFGSLRISE